MDHANQPPGQPPPDSSSTQPFRFTPGWPAGYGLAPGYEPSPGSGATPGPGPPPGSGPHPGYGPPLPGTQPPGTEPPGGGPGPQRADAPGPHPSRGHPRRVLRWTGGIAAVALLGAGGAVAGLKLTGSSAPSNTPSAVALDHALGSSAGAGRAGSCRQAAAGSSAGGQAQAGQCRRTHLLRLVRGMYGQVAYHGQDGTTATLAFERGKVESASGGRLMVRAADGTTWTWDVAGNAVVREHGSTAPSGALSSGARVFVAGQVSGGSRNARLVIVRAPNGSAPGSSSRAPASSPATPG
jgi:hypothetical protein